MRHQKQKTNKQTKKKNKAETLTHAAPRTSNYDNVAFTLF